MAKENKVRLTLTARADKLNRVLRRSQEEIRTLSQTATRANKRIAHSQRMVHKSGGHVIGMFKTMAIMGAAFGVVKLTRDFFDFDRALRQTAATGNMTAKSISKIGRDNVIAKFKEEIVDAAKKTKTSREEILGGVDAIIQKIGQPEFARASAPSIGKVALATGAAGPDIGSIYADLRVKQGLSPEESERYFDILLAQGKQGSFILQRMAEHLGPLLSTAVAHGLTGEKEFRRFGAFMQTAEAGIRNPAETATAMRRVIDDIGQAAPLLRRSGIEVYKTNERGFKIGRDIVTIIEEIFEATRGDPEKLRLVFKKRSLRAINEFRAQYAGGQILPSGKKFLGFEKLVGLGGDLKNLNRDFQLISEGGASDIQNLQTSFQELIETMGKLPLAGFIEAVKGLTRALNELSEKGFLGAIQDNPATAAKTVGAGAAGFGAYKALKLVKNALSAPREIAAAKEPLTNIELNKAFREMGKSLKESPSGGLFSLLKNFWLTPVGQAGLTTKLGVAGAGLYTGYLLGDYLDEKLNLTDNLADRITRMSLPEPARPTPAALKKLSGPLINSILEKEIGIRELLQGKTENNFNFQINIDDRRKATVAPNRAGGKITVGVKSLTRGDLVPREPKP